MPCPGTWAPYQGGWLGSGVSWPDAVLQVGPGRVVREPGEPVDLAGLVVAAGAEREAQGGPRLLPLVPTRRPGVAVTHSQGHAGHLIRCAVSTPPHGLAQG